MKTMKVTMGAAAMAALLVGCASRDDVRYSDARDIYREDYPQGQTMRLLPGQQRQITRVNYEQPRVVVVPRRDQVEISQTDRAMAMRLRAAQNYRNDLALQETLAPVGPASGEVASGTVSTSVRREIASASTARLPVPVDYVAVDRVAVDRVALEPVAERTYTGYYGPRVVRRSTAYGGPRGYVGVRREATLPPVAERIPNQIGFVRSPFAPASGYIDVSGLPSGSQARDPYTGKVFTVP